MNATGKPLKVIFNEALDRTDPAERARYLAEACGTNLDLRRQAEELIAAHDRAGGDLLPTQQSDAPATVLGASALVEQPGTRIGRYKLLENIGEGGFGVVYMAEQREPVKRRVALKIIKLGMDTKQTVARFEAERQALAMMDHPNIAKVFDAGATDTGRPYFVMELVRGIPMTKFCDENSLTTEERLDLFVQVCQAIQHAHQKGIIHRDIKPSNVLVTMHDEKAVPKVIDFGIAKATQQELTDKTLFTQFQQFIGTPAYMSPEQAQMSGLDIDTRSDIYSLGVLLYELLTGTTPFDPKELLSGGYEEIRRRIREEEPARPSTRVSTMEQQRLTTLAKYRKCDPGKLKAALRGDLDWIVMKAMEKDRTRRYDTANGLAMDIKRFLQQEPVVARPPNTAYRIQKFVRRNQATVVGGAVILVALVLGLSLAAIGWWQASAERDKAVKARAAEELQRRQAQASERKAEEAQTKEAQLRQSAETQELAARRQAYAADMNILHQALRVNNLRRARQLLDRHRPKPGELDLRGWEWRYLWQRCRGDAEFKLCQQPVRVLYGGFTPDGTRAAIFDDSGRISVWDVATRREVAELQAPVFEENEVRANSGQASLSADGEWMAASSKGQAGQHVVKVWKIKGGEIVAEFQCEGGRVAALAFSPDTKQLAVYVQDRAVFVWNVGTRALDARLPVAPASTFYGSVKFSPDGKMLAIGEGNGRVRLVEAASGNESSTLTVSTTQGIMTLAFSPDGRRLAVGVGSNDPVVSVWDVATRTRMHGLAGHTGFVIHLAFSPDGKTLASASADETIKLWNTSTWKEESTLLSHDDEVWSVSFSRDSKQLLRTGKDGAVYVWSASPELSRIGIAALAAPLRSNLRVHPVWDVSPDSTTLAAVGSDGVVSLWDSVTFVKKITLSALGTNNSTVFWSHTGHLVVGDEPSSQVKIWNLASGTVTSHSLNTGGRRLAWRFLPKLGILVLADPSERTVRLWSLDARKEDSSFTVEKSINDLAVSSDAPLLAIGTSQGEILVRNLATERFENIFKAHASSIQGLSFLPGSRFLASASPAAPTIKVWDLTTTNEVVALPGFNLVISHIAASPDGRRLAAASIGHEPIKIWDTASWEEVANLEGSDPALRLAGFFPDGNSLAAFDRNRMLHFFRAPSNEEIAAAEKPKAP